MLSKRNCEWEKLWSTEDYPMKDDSCEQVPYSLARLICKTGMVFFVYFIEMFTGFGVVRSALGELSLSSPLTALWEHTCPSLTSVGNSKHLGGNSLIPCLSHLVHWLSDLRVALI